MKLAASEEPKKKENRRQTVTCLVYLLIMVIALAIAGAQPYFEMRAFNRHTKGEKATYMDAVFSDLRIITDNVK